MIKISQTSKLKARSWSLPALETCPGARTKGGALVEACQGCYATTGNYRFPSVKAPREHNKEDWKRPEWVADMVSELDADRYFRWFDSGDLYRVELAEKVLQVMEQTPHCNHWIPTRSHKSPRIEMILRRMEALPNVVVRRSSDSVTGEADANHGSTIIPTPEDAHPGMFVCGAYSRDGKCGDCRACWSKDVPLVAYPAHGQKMRKVIRIAVA
ncbi:MULTISPECIES: hypothetical protein [unclassified Thioalkalivibrio]|uniref:GP88 family protein n=1 Tax=unclassified Thioalkalivibrio TaxID=2621013 RepID=UPI0003611637|nr:MULTISPECIES: hypothetical protein [unclassified Thioalkalivibrio]